MTNPRKRKAKSVKAKPTKQTQPEPQPGPSQTDDSVCQAESDPPPPELQAEGEVQPNEEEDSLEVDEGSGLATKKKKLLTALTPEQEEEMVEWLSEHPVLWNKKMKDYKDTQMKLKSEMRSFKSNENIHKKEGGSYYVVSANKASSVTLQSPGNESQRKHTAILRISNRQSIQRLIKNKMGSK